MKQTPVAVGIPLDTIRRVESVRDAMAESTGLDVSRNKVFNLCIEAGLPLVRAKLGLPVAPDTVECIAADKSASAMGPVETRTLGYSDAPAPRRGGGGAARDERARVERERRRALGCNCKANHKRACPLRGERVAAGEDEAAS